MHERKRAVVRRTIKALPVALMAAAAVFAAFGSGNAADAQTSVSTAKSGSWSDPGVWSTGAVPDKTQRVAIQTGHTVVLDAKGAVKRLSISGTLEFSRTRSTELEAGGNIIVENGGRLLIGTEAAPLPRSVTATIRFDVPAGTVYKGGLVFEEVDTGLWVFGGGTWESHGAPVANTWAKLAGDAGEGARSVTVEGDLSDWRAGGSVLITATGRNISEAYGVNNFFTEDEVRTIKSVRHAGGVTTVELNSPLTYGHSGSGDAKGELALLSRNIVITSKTALRAHTVYKHGALGSPSYTQFKNLGPIGVLGRYPVHFHTLGETGIGRVVRGNAIWDSNNRWVVVHNTIGMLVEDNVAFMGVNTGYWLESTAAGEHGPRPVANTLVHNLGVKMTGATRQNRRESAFYAERANHFIGNVAVSVSGSTDTSGFHWPENGIASEGHLFLDNEAHSNLHHGAFGWQNSGEYHVVGLKTWRNGDTGVFWGAYRNTVQFHGLESFGNGSANFRARSSHVFIQGSSLYGEQAYPTDVGLRISPFTLPPSLDDPARIIATSFSNHSVFDVTHDRQEPCGSDPDGCIPTYFSFLNARLASIAPIRFGTDWETRDVFFDFNGLAANRAGLPPSFRMSRPDLPQPSTAAYQNDSAQAWVDPTSGQAKAWPLPPEIAWTSAPASSGAGKMTFSASASGYTSPDGALEFFVDEFEDAQPWKSEYFANVSLKGPAAASFSKDSPDFSYNSGGKVIEPALMGILTGGSWSARFTHTLISAGGKHHISFSANDGIRLYVDGKELANMWTAREQCCPNEGEIDVSLTPGAHAVVIEYYAGDSTSADLSFSITRPVKSGALSGSFTFDPAAWPRRYAHVFARAHDPATGLFAYTPTVTFENPAFHLAGLSPNGPGLTGTEAAPASPSSVEFGAGISALKSGADYKATTLESHHTSAHDRKR